jgi:tetratricopeptide (TPR) repeat protein
MASPPNTPDPKKSASAASDANTARNDEVARAIDLCRKGRWKDGIVILGRLVEAADPGSSNLPGRAYSYLGHGIAREQRRFQDGIRLCKHGIKIEFYQAENYLNLARTLLLIERKEAAVRAVRDGLAVDRKNRELLLLRRELGVRRSPVLSFLSRENPVNVLLGRLRHRFRTKRG